MLDSIALSNDGKTLAFSVYQPENSIQIWDLEAKSLRAEFGTRKGPGDTVTGYYPAKRLAFSPDGKTLFAAFDEGEVEIWDLDKIDNPEQARSLIKVGGPMDGFYGLHIDPAGKHLITHNGNDTLYVLRLKQK